ncbi:hypothetical protein [Thermomonospora cellulosilytica]|uniref:Uncharacterized protein n=1 Tax=Thermomonospora cellulosilytica TaxID=1411118 RepID=A0A7W3MVV8_9ACTN|nr:hypothetical protein [Thermomonospora cellulosilytica]MBA9002860.1 hypothetical protein [Thermomonospora cellulosilytica]
MATFGELFTTADGHLAQAATVLDRPEAERQLHHPATVDELARLTGILARYGDRITEGFGLPSSDTEAVRAAARSFTRDLHQARRILGEPEWREPNGPDLAWTLRAASTTLGCGLDLLTSHTTPAQTQPPTANATVITSPEASAALLHRLGHHARTVAHLAERSTPHARQATHPLLEAATRTAHLHPAKALALEGMRLRQTGQRIPPITGENTTQLLHGIHVSAQRLRNLDTLAGTTTWRYLATAAAITCRLSSHLTGVITRRLRDLGHPNQALQFVPAGHDIRTLGRKWQAIAREWTTLTETRTTPGNAPVAVDASDLIIRLGRLIYTDPAWTPGPKGRNEVIPPEHLVSDVTQAARLGLAVLRSVEACTVLAAAHHTAVTDATKIALMRRKLPRYAGHRIPAAGRTIRARYDNTHQHGQKTTTTIGKALLAITPDRSPLAAETALILHRATAPTSHESPAALAAQSFPTVITQALQALNKHATTDSPPTNNPSQGPRRTR